MIPGDGLLTNARDLQNWLDQIGSNVTYFKYEVREEGRPIEIDIQFSNDEEAEIFCSQFEGKFLVH